MLDITFNNETNINMDEWEIQATQLITSIIETLKITVDVNLGINFVDKKTALRLNQEFRNEQYVPDVLSFPSGLSSKEAQQIGLHELGDLFICYEVAQKKAQHYHHDLSTEMAFLFVHGTLHLLGYDHEKNHDRKKMFNLQAKILKANGINYLVIYDELSYLEE